MPDDDVLRKEHERLRFERDLYRSILNLDTAESLEPFLERALDLVMSITGSRRGLLGLGRTDDTSKLPAEWWASRTEEDEREGLQRRVSSAIVRQALAEGRSVQTPSAFLDPRFEDRHSVRSHQIESVLCVPIGDRLGVVYVEGHRRTGPFPREDVDNVELFAREVERIATRLLVARRRTRESDPTRPYRERMRLDEVVGSSLALADLLAEVEVCARSQATVLLTGASGTGKSAFARLIHNHSRRSSGPFVEVNCAAFPDELIESELFGAEAGAHSTARSPVPGRIAGAEGGTLFLDEVAELSPRAQAKLLQFLNDKVYYPLGAQGPRRADVRILSATNVDLEQAVAEKRFRPDLFYRLEVLRVRVPSLSERRGDIPELLEHFCRQKAADNHLPTPTLAPSALAAAEVADWPGNVRELAALVERAVVRAAQSGRSEIDASLLFDRRSTPAVTSSDLRAEYPDSLHDATRMFQRSHIKRILEATGGNAAKAARRLDIARSHLYKLRDNLGLAKDGSEEAG